MTKLGCLRCDWWSLGAGVSRLTSTDGGYKGTSGSQRGPGGQPSTTVKARLEARKVSVTWKGTDESSGAKLLQTVGMGMPWKGLKEGSPVGQLSEVERGGSLRCPGWAPAQEQE